MVCTSDHFRNQNEKPTKSFLNLENDNFVYKNSIDSKANDDTLIYDLDLTHLEMKNIV